MILVNGNRYGKPYVQRTQYGSAAQATSHTITFSQTPASGNLLLIFALTDLGTMTTPSGWTADITKAVGGINLVCFKRIASASEATSISITCTASIMAAVAFEFSGGFLGTVDDNGLVTINQAQLTNDLTSAITANAVDLMFGAGGFYNSTHNNTGNGPYTFDKSFVQQGYALAVSSGTSGKSIEIIIGYRKSTATGTYDTNVTSTTTEAATTTPGFIVAYK